MRKKKHKPVQVQADGKFHGKTLTHMRNQVFGAKACAELYRVERKMESFDSDKKLSDAEAKRARRLERNRKLAEAQAK